MKISVITVCLNSAKTIEQTIQSVIGQDDTDFEYIIIDGGSEDGTLDIIEKYRKNITILISELDNGIYDAMNKGITLASGEVIGIINSDDWYEPGALKNVRKCFQKSDADIVYGRLRLIFEDETSYIQTPSNIEKIRYEMSIPHPTVFVRKEIYEKYGMFQMEYKIAADYELMLRLYISGVKFIYDDNVFANFRIGGVSDQQRRKCGEETQMIAQKYLHFTPLIYRKYCRDIILHRWKVLRFLKMLDKFPHMLFDTLNKSMGVSIYDEIAVFGAGELGIRSVRALTKSGIESLVLIDNDRKKWDAFIEHIRVCSPENLKEFNGVLLLMVEKFTDEILSQIEKIRNEELYCITWEEIVTEVGLQKLDNSLFD